MNRLFYCLLLVFGLSACGKSDFMQDIQGKWRVTEVNYIYDFGTTSYYPPTQYFIFQNSSYQHWQSDTLNEIGGFTVNGKVSQITFYSQFGNNNFDILEKSETNQHWQSKNKIIDFYLGFKLEKIQ